MMVALLLLLEENRSRHAVLVIVPMAVMVFAIPLVRTAVGYVPWGTVEWVDALLPSLSLGLTAAWLLLRRLESRTVLVSAIDFVAVLVVVGVLVGTCDNLASVSLSTALTVLLLGVFNGLVGTIWMIGLVTAGRICRANYSPARFTGWLVLSIMVLLVILATPVSGVLAAMFPGSEGRDAGELILIILRTMEYSMATGVGLTLALLPFLVLTFYSPLYHPRFLRFLRIQVPPLLMQRPESRPHCAD